MQLSRGLSTDAATTIPYDIEGHTVKNVHPIVCSLLLYNDAAKLGRNQLEIMMGRRFNVEFRSSE